ncbi:glycosyltransferase family 2 protein [Fodinibius sp.]|uniref:glycosyltransferase family 2 protein n=1 Tax=Fodinibius sp. TaxID=1872440 RepID=UPI0035650A31
MTTTATPKVYIILVNWNGWEDTTECLRSLEELDYANYSVIVVDNGSTDRSVEKIERRFPHITLLKNDENRGFAGGNNTGIEYAMDRDAEYVWLLNNDTVVDRQALSHLVERIEEDAAIGICGSRLIYYHQRDTTQAWGGGRFNKWTGTIRSFGQNKPVDLMPDRRVIEKKMDYVVGASMLVSGRFIDRVGLLSEEYFLYYEEIDWAMRGEGQFSLGFAPGSIVYHKEGASTGGQQLEQASRSRQSDYYQLKNRLKFTCKFFPAYLPGVYLSVIYAMINRMRRGQWSRIPMIIKLMFTFNT